MIRLCAQTRILVAIKPIDFRKQIDGIVAICSHQLHQNPRSGTLFVFINRAHTMIRILAYDNNGYYLITKRISQGRFAYWPKQVNTPTHTLPAAQLRAVLLNAVEVPVTHEH